MFSLSLYFIIQYEIFASLSKYTYQLHFFIISTSSLEPIQQTQDIFPKGTLVTNNTFLIRFST